MSERDSSGTTSKPAGGDEGQRPKEPADRATSGEHLKLVRSPAGDASEHTDEGVKTSAGEESATPEARSAIADERVRRLERELAETKSTLAQAREALEAGERRRRIDQELVEAEAIDVETARLLTEAALARESGADVTRVVAELRQRKPFLFRARTASRARSAAPMRRGSNGQALGDLAARARASGDRSELIRYLRARRGE